MEATPCALTLPEPVEAEDDLEEPVQPFVHRLVPAAGRKPPPTVGLHSVFELASPKRDKLRVLFTRTVPPPVDVTPQPAERPRYFTAAERAPGAVRVIGGQYPANRWTDERQDHEERRRAAQKYKCPPPRPGKAYRSKSKKLRTMLDGAARTLCARHAEFALYLAAGHAEAVAYRATYPHSAAWPAASLQRRADALAEKPHVLERVSALRVKLAEGKLQPPVLGQRIAPAPPRQRSAPEADFSVYLDDE